MSLRPEASGRNLRLGSLDLGLRVAVRNGIVFFEMGSNNSSVFRNSLQPLLDVDKHTFHRGKLPSMRYSSIFAPELFHFLKLTSKNNH